MANAERLEDLGVARERMFNVLENTDVFDRCNSKHDIDDFIKKYLNEESLEELHYKLRAIKENLYDVFGVLCGYDDHEDV